jgi:hypothetical protein
MQKRLQTQQMILQDDSAIYWLVLNGLSLQVKEALF